MDFYNNENPYFQDEYIYEEQYISYNNGIYNYENDWEAQRWDGGIEVREEVSKGWEEEVRGKGVVYECDEPGQVYRDYQPETQTDDEIGYNIPYVGSTPPWEHSYPTLDSPFTDYTYAMPSQWTYQSPSLPCYSWKWWLTIHTQWPQPSNHPPCTPTHPLPTT